MDAKDDPMKARCFAEIVQRLTWLLDEAAGGRGLKDYIPEAHDLETRAYINGLLRAIDIIMKCSGKIEDGPLFERGNDEEGFHNNSQPAL